MKPTDLTFIADSSMHKGKAALKSNSYNPHKLSRKPKDVFTHVITILLDNECIFEYYRDSAWGIVKFSVSEQEGLTGLLTGELHPIVTGGIQSIDYDMEWEIIQRSMMINDDFVVLNPGKNNWSSSYLLALEEAFYEDEMDKHYSSFLEDLKENFGAKIIDERFKFEGQVAITKWDEDER